MVWNIVDETHQKIIAELEAQTDRGAAIIGAALLDQRLTEAIQSRLLPEEKIRDKLLGKHGPIGTFGAKIDLAYSLGLYGKQSHRDLNLIRDIRNEFAHFGPPLDFTSQKIVQKCSELWLPRNHPINNQPPNPTGARAQYFRAVNILSSHLWQESKNSPPPHNNSSLP